MFQELLQPVTNKIISKTRSRCEKCPRSKDIKTTNYCSKCKSFLCKKHLKHTARICDICISDNPNKTSHINKLDEKSQLFKINQSDVDKNISSKYLCRTCLSIHNEVTSIFDYCYHSAVYINEMIMSLCSVQIGRDDNLPKMICVKCIEDIKMAYLFKKNCESAEVILKQKQLIQPMPTKSIKIEITDNQLEDPLTNNYGINLYEVQIKELVNYKQEIDDNFTNFIDDNYQKNQTKSIDEMIDKTEINFTSEDDHSDNVNSKTIVATQIKIKPTKNSTPKMHSCNFCNYKSSESSNVKRHMRKHTNDRPYVCEICNHGFARSETLKEHQRTHSGEKPFLCDQCHYRSASNTSLRVHKTNKHSQEKKFACNECSYRTKTKTALLNHKKTHSGIKNYSCDLCSYEAIQLNCLERHKMMVHSGERPYMCDQCPYKCVNANYLKIHKRTHLTIRRFSCDECPYTCHTQHKLKCHKRIHTGEKPYECDHCGFKSASMSSLKRHIKSHSEMEFRS